MDFLFKHKKEITKIYNNLKLERGIIYLDSLDKMERITAIKSFKNYEYLVNRTNIDIELIKTLIIKIEVLRETYSLIQEAIRKQDFNKLWEIRDKNAKQNIKYWSNLY